MIHHRYLPSCLALVFAINAADAATKSWDGGGGTTNWADANNWNANGVPTSTDQIYLTTAAPKIIVPDVANCGVFGVDGPVAATLLATADLVPVVLNLYGITGKPLVYLGPSAPTSVTADNVIFQLGTTGDWWVETGKSLIIINGYIAQNAFGRGLNKTGGGTLKIDGSSGFTGQTNIKGGTLALGPNGLIRSSSKVAIDAGATFDVTALAAGFSVSNGQILAGKGTVNGFLTTVNGATVSTDTGIGTLTITNGFTLASGAHLPLEINGTGSYDAFVVSGGNVTLAGDLVGTTFGYTPAIGDTFYLIRNTGSGSTTGTISGAGDGGTVDLGGMRFRVSLTSDFGGSGFAVGGTGNDVAIRRIQSPPQASVIGTTNTAAVQMGLIWEDIAVGETAYQVYRVLADGSLDLLATLPAGATSFSETVPNYTSYTYAVQAIGAAGSLGALQYSDPIQAGNSLATRRSQMVNWLGVEVPNLTQTVDGPHRIGRMGFWNGEARLLRGDNSTGLYYITTALEDADPSGVDNPGFSMWPGMDAWFRWNHLFPQSLKDRYKAIYTYCPHYNTGATPNQRFMLCVAAYLAYGVWGNDMFLNSGAYYGTSDPTGKAAILNVLNTTPWKNFEEHNSNHYLQYSLAPMETLALYAPDAEVRNKARMVVDWGLAEASGYWHNGHWCVSSTRGAAAIQQYDYDITPWTWRMFFGGPTPYNSSFADSHATLPFATPEFPGILPEIETAGRDRMQSYTRRSFAQRSAGPQLGYFKQAWMTPKYGLWSQVEGTIGGYNSDGSIILANLNTVAVQDGYQGQRWALAWDSPPGGNSVLTITTPTNYGTATGSGISIYEDTLQKEDTMIAVYNIPASGGTGGNNGDWPNQYLKGYIPSGYSAITDEAATTGRIFLHYDSVLVSIYLSNPFAWSTSFTTACGKAGLAIETAPVTEFPQATAAERLAAFRTAVLATAPDSSAVTAAAPRLVYTNRHGRVLDLTYGQAGKIDGVTVDYQSWPMLEDPWMSQHQRGHLHIFGKDRTIVSNYYNWTKTINNRPMLSTAAPVAVTTPVDIDLGTRAQDSETSVGQLHFTVANPVNGSVALLADGRTARFTPAASYAGAASFAFAANDRGIHPQLVWNYDFEPPADLTSGTIPDVSGTNRAAAVQIISGGSASLLSGTPAALGPNSTQAIRLNSSASSGARLAQTVTRSTLEMSNGNWTFSTWFKRATNTSDDFVFYVGSGDGFGGSGNELQLYCPANSDTLRLSHYSATNVLDFDICSATAVTPGQWHHAAITFEKTTDYTGTLRLYLNGTSVGSNTVTLWYLSQDQPLILGGHASTSASLSRYFDGWLDDTALFRGTLGAQEIASLATQAVATFGGLGATGAVSMNVSNTLESWRQLYFHTAANSGDAADTADPDGDGVNNLMEYALGTVPDSTASRTAPVLATDSNRLTLSFTRFRSDVTYIVESGSDLSNWSPVATNPGTVGQSVTVSDTVDISTANPPRRFMRLHVTDP